jgi:transglutaminase-like putative cysteine protease
MSIRCLRRVLPGLLCLLPGALLSAAVVQTPATHESVEEHFRVESDGSFRDEVFTQVRINTREGVEQWSQVQLPWSVSRQSLEVLEAYVITPGGQRLEVSADTIFTKEDPASVGAPMFSDNQRRIIVFPQLQPGARLAYRYRLSEKIPLFPNHFTDEESYSIYADWEHVRLSYDVPANMHLQVEAHDLPAWQSDAKPERGRKILGWQLNRTLAVAAEPGAVSSADFSPRVALSNFADYAAIGDAYTARARDKAALTPKVQQLADEITLGVEEPREQAQKIYDWVAKNIRYVAIYFSSEGVVPHSADTIIDSRYGDCKDHSTLLQALLAAKKIASAQVLISTDSRFATPQIPIPFFNHAINYLPRWNLFVDSTNELAPFGTLSASERGRKVVLATAVPGLPRYMPTPPAAAEQSVEHADIDARIDSDGTLHIEETTRGSGDQEIGYRGFYSRVVKGTEAQVAQSILTSAGIQGTGSLEYGDPRDLDHPFHSTLRYESLDAALVPGPAAIALPSSFSLNIPGGTQRQTPLVCNASRRERSIRLRFPEATQFIAVPQNVDFSNAIGSYHAHYQRDGNSVIAERRMDFNQGGQCAPEQLPAMQALGRIVNRDMRAQVLYK